MSTTTKAEPYRTAEDKFADELIRQHLAGHITVRGIIGEAFRQGEMHGEAKSAAPEMLEALERILAKPGDTLYVIEQTNAAIQKARGGQ